MTQNDTAILQFRGPWSVPIEVSSSIIFLLFLVVGVHAGGGTSGLVDGAIICVILIGSILLHELGHAWGARVQGIPVSRVVLHGGGGACLHSAAPARASEFIVAMGPLVNLALWAMLSLGAEGVWATIPHGDFAAPLDHFAMRLNLAAWLWFAAELNLMLFVLNLIPIQPLDGGKLLHLGLLRVLSPSRALKCAGAIGLICAVLWIPAMVVMFVTFGFVLLFLPNLRLHWHMMRGGARLDGLRR